MIDKHKQGRRNRQSGARFERKVREDLINKGWFVTKFQSNIEFDVDGKGRLIPAKGNRFFARTLGFPDYLCFRQASDKLYYVEGCECKSTGYLTPIEKQKCQWLIDNHVFSDVLIAKKNRTGRKIVPEYVSFKEKYGGKQ
jgi:hypothetical protein